MKYRSSRLEETRTSVLRAIRDPGNQTAWNRFFDLYAGYLFSLARRSGLLDADADDVVQTVLVEVAGKMRDFTYDRSKGRFRGWLATCARYRINDARARLRRNRARETGGPAGAYTGTAFMDNLIDGREDAFDRLAEEEWQALVMGLALEKTRARVALKAFELFHAYVIDEWPVARVMETYGVSRDVVYQAKRRVGKVFAQAVLDARQEAEQPGGGE